MKFINKYSYNIFIAISISIILRLIFLSTYGDFSLENEWGTLYKNLKIHGVLAFRSFEGNLIPSVYMPPLYAYFIFFIDYLKPNKFDLVNSILVIQILLSSISIYYFNKINLMMFNKKISIISSYFFSLFPLNIYASIQISSISLQIFLSIIFLYLIFQILSNKNNLKILILLGFISGLTILLRGEFVVIFIFTIIFIFFVKKINIPNLIIIFLISLLTVSPYLIRNYITFEKITITKSFGYNLWKGNNIDATVEGSESINAFDKHNIDEKLNALEKNKLYDFNYDKIFLESSLKFIEDNPVLFFERYLKKFLSFVFFNINSNYPNYYSILNIIPLIFVSFIFFISFYKIIKIKKSVLLKYLLFNLFLTVAIFSVFFILPRYKLIILPIQLIIINFWLNKYFKKGV